ncbi:hypothetical protein K438DRAFT_1764931 [Mycena galopus ATCC 62051]|nr:hypothetical protein K438DRAFT_1764931 [Mycena galopus ATCC 62051]
MAYMGQLRTDGYAEMVDHARRHKAQFDRKVLARAPKEVIFRTGSLVQQYETKYETGATFLVERKMVPMWSAPRRVTSRARNSYKIETLEGLLINGRFSSRLLWQFVPRRGTVLDKLQREWAAGLEELGIEDAEDDEDLYGDDGHAGADDEQEEVDTQRSQAEKTNHIIFWFSPLSDPVQLARLARAESNRATADPRRLLTEATPPTPMGRIWHEGTYQASGTAQNPSKHATHEALSDKLSAGKTLGQIVEMRVAMRSTTSAGTHRVSTIGAIAQEIREAEGSGQELDEGEFFVPSCTHHGNVPQSGRRWALCIPVWGDERAKSEGVDSNENTKDEAHPLIVMWPTSTSASSETCMRATDENVVAGEKRATAIAGNSSLSHHNIFECRDHRQFLSAEITGNHTDTPITTVVEHVSEDNHCCYREEVWVEPPSPVKRQ